MAARVLVAGVGNELCRDDGLGIALARALGEQPLPPGVTIFEAGIAGISLVQELLDGYDALIILDAIDRGGEPGTPYLLDAAVPALAELPEEERRVFLADTHYAVPGRALILSQALDVLPPRVHLLGCQPADQDLGLGLSDEVAAVVPELVSQVTALLVELCGTVESANGAKQ
jgi:hydrogenase maturation protease